MRIGFIAGNFDLLHYGHIKTIKKCACMCDELYVLVNTDTFSKRYKRACIMNENERIKTLEAVFEDDYINIELNDGEEDTTKTIDKILKKYKLDKEDKVYIFHGDDWTGEALYKQMGITDKWMKKNNVEMWYFNRSGNISTSEIIERCKMQLYGHFHQKDNK